jgi:hypothetical protein
MNNFQGCPLSRRRTLSDLLEELTKVSYIRNDWELYKFVYVCRATRVTLSEDDFYRITAE